MTLEFMDGFDHYETIDTLKKWTRFNSSFAAGTTNPGTSQAWARPPGGQGMNLAGGQQLTRVLSGNISAAIVVGCNFYRPSSVGSHTMIIFGDATSEQCSVRMASDGKLTFTRNGTVLATSTNAILANTWYFIEVKATVHNSAGTYEVRVNGSVTNWIAAATGANTRSTGNNYCNEITIGGGNSWYDDFYILNCTSSPNNDFLGEQKIITLYPNGAGNYTQWTPNWMTNFANINEKQADNDNTFNQSSTANQIDTFIFDDLPTSTIAAIQPVIEARKDAGAARTICTLSRIGGTDYEGTTKTLTGSNLMYPNPHDTSPTGSGSACTTAEINGAEFGYKLKS